LLEPATSPFENYIGILDHIIVAGGETISLAERGLI